MRKILLLSFSCFLTGLLSAQALFYNEGADIYVKPGGYMIVKTNSLQNDLGTLNNAGTVVIEQNFINNATATGLASATGLYRVHDTWQNNSTFTADRSTVDLYGGNQSITGSQVTSFYNLNLLGGNFVKSQTLNSQVMNTLNLDSAELATNQFDMFVSNASPNAILRPGLGFVSSLDTGKLSRSTNSSSTYVFATGSPSSISATIYRPIEMNPTSNASNIYGVRLIKGDATLDTFDITKVDTILCKVNPNFYHRLYHTNGGTPSDVRMFFDSTTDGNWSDNAHWSATNLWTQMDPNPVISSASNFITVQSKSWSDFNPHPFALASRKPTVNAGNDQTIVKGQSATISPTIASNLAYTVLWTPSSFLNCDTCESPVSTPDATTTYVITVTDQNKCKASDDIRIIVSSHELLIPTAFSPNGDGMNDEFHPLNSNFKRVSFSVWDRWGQKIFESNDPKVGWDGTYKGDPQPLGVYVYKVEYLFEGDKETTVSSGNVTLLR